MPLSTLTLDSPQYCTDEDVLDEIDADFWQVAPGSALVAAGKDGLIAQAAPWTLTSPATDFAALGVTPGRVVKLNAPFGSVAARVVTTSNFFGIVVSAAGNSLLLRRPHAAASGVGQPFVPAGAGDAAGLVFEIRTLDPHLRHAARQFRQDLKSIAPDATLAAVLDDQDLTDGNLYYAISDLYFGRSESLAATGTGADIFGEKARLYRGYRDDQLARIEKRVTTPVMTEAPVKGSLATGSFRVGRATRAEWE